MGRAGPPDARTERSTLRRREIRAGGMSPLGLAPADEPAGAEQHQAGDAGDDAVLEVRAMQRGVVPGEEAGSWSAGNTK